MNHQRRNGGSVSRYQCAALLALMLGVGMTGWSADSPGKREYTPRTGSTRATRNQPTAAKVPEPVVLEGVMRSAMGYPRVFARIFSNGQMITGRPAHDVIQRARALNGDYMDLNLAASSGPHAWWTAVVDTGAEDHFVNQDTAERFGLGGLVSGLSVVTGVDGEDIKGQSWVYGLSLAGSNGRLNETPGSPFIPVQPAASFTLDLKQYQPLRRVNPAGANLVGMSAIHSLALEIDNGNATVAMLAQALDMSSARAFEESLQNLTAGPRVRLLPPAFRPTNAIVRIPLRYINTRRIATGAAGTATAHSITPFVMGVRGRQSGREAVGNFILDTGSSMTMISRKVAYALGLIASADPAQDRPEFRERFTGINDRELETSGYVLDSLALRAPDGSVVEWRNIPVLVHDVRERQEDGSYVTHDGILGNNLFMHSTNGEIDDRGLKIHPAAFERYWIHGPLGELWLQRPPTEPGG